MHKDPPKKETNVQSQILQIKWSSSLNAIWKSQIKKFDFFPDLWQSLHHCASIDATQVQS